MLPSKLRNLFLLSVPLFIAHGIEEYLMGFSYICPLAQAFGRYFESIPQATFATFQLTWWLLLLVSSLFILGGKWPLRLMVVVGFIYLYEFHHIFEAIVRWGYYPGLFTAFLFPVIAILFWRELFHTLRAPDASTDRRVPLGTGSA